MQCACNPCPPLFIYLFSLGAWYVLLGRHTERCLKHQSYLVSTSYYFSMTLINDKRERERVEDGVYLVFVETEQNAVFHVFVEAKNYLTEVCFTNLKSCLI